MADPGSTYLATFQVLANLAAVGSTYFAFRSSANAASSARQSTEAIQASRKHALATERSVMVTTLSQISTAWTAVYPLRNLLLGDSPAAHKILDAHKNHPSFREFLESDEWQLNLRRLLHFFELMGIFVHEEMITPALMFDIVTVERWDDHGAGGNASAVNGALYTRLKPTLDFVRHSRGNMYEYYDKFLLPLYFEHHQSIASRDARWWSAEVAHFR